MCVGGTCGCVALKMLRNSGLPWPLIVVLAILAAFVGGMLMGLIYSFLTVTLKANQNVTGLAMTIFGVGTTKFIMLGMMNLVVPTPKMVIARPSLVWVRPNSSCWAWQGIR